MLKVLSLKRKLLLFLLFALIAGGCSILQPLQKRKLIGVFHLIETSKYTEAKAAAEELISDPKASQWPRTWYARGVLSQNAYREGTRRNDRRLTELYTDQLYVILESFNKAHALDRTGRLEQQLAPKYILLANDLQKLGEQQFKSRKFTEALRAFEMALNITEKPMLSLQPDTNLMYNTAMAAYQSEDWNKSILYFGKLHRGGHSANVAHLLFSSHLAKDDTLAAIKTLSQGIDRYEDNQDLVLLLSDLHFRRNKTKEALSTLDKAIKSNPGNYIFHFTKGLIHQKSGYYNNAIETYKEAIRLAPDELMAYVNIATCYYNTGVDIEEHTRTIMDSATVREEKEKATIAFDKAVMWLDKAYDRNPEDPEVLERLYELYKLLRISEKTDIIEGRIE